MAIGSKCIKCTDRYPACQDHCDYGIKCKQERKRQKEAKGEAMSREVYSYYRDKKYRR